MRVQHGGSVGVGDNNTGGNNNRNNVGSTGVSGGLNRVGGDNIDSSQAMDESRYTGGVQLNNGVGREAQMRFLSITKSPVSAPFELSVVIAAKGVIAATI